jgi:hypothetical protein
VFSKKPVCMNLYVKPFLKTTCVQQTTCVYGSLCQTFLKDHMCSANNLCVWIFILSSHASAIDIFRNFVKIPPILKDHIFLFLKISLMTGFAVCTLYHFPLKPQHMLSYRVRCRHIILFCIHL